MHNQYSITLRQQVVDDINRCWQLMTVNSAEALVIARKALALSKRAKEVGMQVKVLVTIADILKYTRQVKKIHSCFESIEKLCPLIVSQQDLAFALKALGVYYRERSETVRAVEYLYRAKALYETLNVPSELAHSLNSLGIALQHSGNYADALRYYFEASHLLVQDAEKSAQIKTLINIGCIYILLHNYEKATSYFEQSLTLSHKHKDLRGMAISLENKGWCCLHTNQSAKAQRYFSKALVLWQKMGNTYATSAVLQAMAIVLTKLQKFQQATTLAKKAYTLAEATEQKDVMIRSLLALADIEYHKQHYSQATLTLEKALKLIEIVNNPGEELAAHQLYTNIYLALGDYQKAFHHKERSEQLNEQLIGTERMKAITIIEVEIALAGLEQKEREMLIRARDAEQTASEKEKELEQLSVSLSKSLKALEHVRDTVKPYLESSKGKTKELAWSVFQEVAKGESRHSVQQGNTYFENTYRDFIRKLHARYPSLTPTEVKVCILIRLNYSTKQIADMLSSSELTVKTHRTRIRRKLHLRLEENLINTLIVI